MSESRTEPTGHFFVRLLKEKPLGAFSGMIVLLFILVAIFAEVLAPYPFAESTRQTGAGGIHQVSARDRPSGASLKPPDMGRVFL